MAVVVSGGNEGLIVEVLGVSDHYGAPHWRVHTAWLAMGTNPDGTIEMVRIGSIHDSRLRPIRPDAPTRHVDELEEIVA
jgi:hypothetical protein